MPVKFSALAPLALVVALESSDHQRPPIQPRDPKAEVLAREAQRRDAYTRLDSASLAALLSADYVSVSAESPCCFHDRAEGIRRLIAHRDAKDPYPITAMRFDSTRVRIFGNVAVVTGVETIDMTFTKHVPPTQRSARLLATNTWVNERGKWMLVGQQRTPAPQ